MNDYDNLPLEEDGVPNWLEAPASTTPRELPTVTRLQALPLYSLQWENFERLCLKYARDHGIVVRSQLYGVKGQAQHGIDLYLRHSDPPRYEVYQCKKVEEFTPTIISEAVERFVKGTWHDRASAFRIMTSHPIEDTKIAEAIESAGKKLEEQSIKFEVLGEAQISDWLKDKPRIVDDFFGRPWVEPFCGSGALKEIDKRHLPNGDGDIWSPVTFDDQRDLGPAIMGRPLGPADAAACPRLYEVDPLLRQLRSAYSARLTGEPGAGKSVCAYQVALEMVKDGWKVFRLSDASKDVPEIAPVRNGERTLFLIDDAHLMPENVLKLAEEKTHPSAVLLSMHTASHHLPNIRGATSIDSRRAVTTIARSLRTTHLAETLRLVHISDNMVGERAGDEPIERRIDHAEDKADFPWQFCFILGGGWRRAGSAADNARMAGADTVLACAAINQIASGDAKTSRARILECLRPANLDISSVDRFIEWLLSQRLLIAADDLRCPHQRFASVVLKQVLSGQTPEGRRTVGRLLEGAVSDRSYPLAGLRSLLHEIRFSGLYQRQFTALISPASLEILTSRCWESTTPQDRNLSCLVATELEAYLPDWRQSIIRDHLHLLAGWISDPVAPSGYGLGHLLNHLRNTDQETLASLVSLSNPSSVATAVSSMSVEDTYSLAEMLRSIANPGSREWADSVSRELDQGKLFALAADWPPSESLYGLAKFCQAIGWYNEALSLDLVECSLPAIIRGFANSPTDTFSDVEDILMSVLRVFDPLGVFVGDLRPDARRLSLARRICIGIDANTLAKQLSDTAKRDLQRAAFVLSFLHRVARRKFEAVVAGIDWDRVDKTIGDDWKNLPHDPEVLVGVAYIANRARSRVTRLIETNAHRIDLFPARLAMMVPNTAFQHVEAGRKIRLVQFDHVDWHFGPGTLALFAKERPGLIDSAIAPWEPEIGRALSYPHPSWYEEAADLLSLLTTASPASLQRILDNVSTLTAESGWTASITKGGGPRRTVSLLIEAAKDRPDSVGLLARNLRDRFPRSSIPD